MSERLLTLSNQIVKKLVTSVIDNKRVTGLTHNFYRYPARFSPIFASSAIGLFSKPGDIVLDPYMGGGTTVVEAVVAGRRAIGADLNSLSVFLTKVKTTRLNSAEKKSISLWANRLIPKLTYRYPTDDIAHLLFDPKTKNLTLPRARFIKKFVAAALDSLGCLETQNAIDFARCAVLKTAQWALDGRKTHTTLTQFRAKLKHNVSQMLPQLSEFESALSMSKSRHYRPKLIEIDAAVIDKAPVFSKARRKVDLVVTSPPYPGLHVLYHRWQVNGRRETPAPYWIAGCQDGQGDSYYNFGSRHQTGLHSYFENSLHTLQAIRRVMRTGAHMVQMLAFSDPQNHLPRYLTNMQTAGFKEISLHPDNRIWRQVPNRKWHAIMKGKLSSSREVVLIHRAN
ncbi:MAG: DNA methyltransferase [Planctomycetota bacterium]|jgi:DNA modification methylase